MKFISCIIAALFIYGCQTNTNTFLFPIHEKNRYGFIDNKGNVVIEPVFRSVGSYSEGMIAARMDDLYGYIDRNGEYLIPPKFEYATDFQEGYAIVYQDSSPFFIDKTGKMPFSCPYAMVSPFKNGLSIVTTTSQKDGIINKSGNLVCDTIYDAVSEIGDRVFKVTSYLNKQENRVGLIDSQGMFIVPMGKYMEIDPFEGKYASVSTFPAEGDSTGETERKGFIDIKGNLLFLQDSSMINGYIFRASNEGITKIDLYRNMYPDEDGILYYSDNVYPGLINLRGEVILNDTSVEDIIDFSCGRGFIQYKNDDYYLVDNQLNRVSSQKFNKVCYGGFSNGFAFVKIDTSKKYGVINTKGEFVFKPQFDDVGGTVIDDYFIFSKNSPTEKNAYRRLYGVAGTDGRILIEPKFEDFDPNGFKGGLLMVKIDSNLCYINKKGKIVWQDKNEEYVEDPNIDYMTRGYFYAFSEPNKDELGGFAKSQNTPRAVESKFAFPEGKVSILVDINQPCIIDDLWNGYKAFIINTTNDNIRFNAQDSRLNAKLQAQDLNGEWRDIEYLPSSWCGNSYHTLTLKQQEFWEFSIPKYSGSMRTTMRVALEYNDPVSKGKFFTDTKTITIYSNAFAGSINHSQFWRKQGYSATSIMDPYVD